MKALKRASLFGLLLLIVSCDFGLPTGGGTGGEGLSGVIVDPQGNRVAGAFVRVYPARSGTPADSAGATERDVDSAITDEDGVYRLEVKAGRYHLEASFARGDTVYALIARNVSLDPALTKVPIRKVFRAARVSLEIRGAGGGLLSGAHCAIAASRFETTSDLRGVCEFPIVPPGDHEISVTAEGMALTVLQVRLAAGTLATRDVQVKPVEGDDLPVGWRFSGLQGFVFHLPPDLFLSYEGYMYEDTDTWQAIYSGQEGLTMAMRSGPVFPLPRPDSFPEYREVTFMLDTNVRATLVTYAVPPGSPEYRDIYKYDAGLEIEGHSPDELLIFSAQCATRSACDRAEIILESMKKWKGPGPAPVSPPPVPFVRAPSPDTTLDLPVLFAWQGATRIPMGKTILTTFNRLQIVADTSSRFYVVNDSVPHGIEILSRTVTTLEPSRTYFWRVTAYGPGGQEASAWRRLTTR